VLQSAADFVIEMIAGGNHTTTNRLEAGVRWMFPNAAAIGFAVSASPMLTSLVTFLFSDKKVTPILLSNCAINSNLTQNRRCFRSGGLILTA